MMFKLYTPEMRDVFKRSKALAQQHQHKAIDPEHVLLTMLDDPGVAKLLSDLHANTTELRQELQRSLSKAPKLAGAEEIVLSNRLLKAGAAVERDASVRKIEPIEARMMLIGLTAEPKDPLAKLLANQNVDADKVSEVLFQTVSSTSAKAKSGKEESTISKYTTNLTDRARRGLVGPIIGREKEIRQVQEVLTRAKKNNPVLIGNPGVGRNSIVEGLACRIARGDVPDSLKKKKILILDLAALVSGATLRGQFEERVKSLMNEVKSDKNIILFVEQIDTMVGTGGEGASDASNLIKPALARGEVQVLGTTTPDEYRNSIEEDAALERRFEPIQVSEPSEAEALTILRGIKAGYEAHHRVKIDDTALVAAVKFSKRYMASKHLPEKAVGLMDAAASRLRLSMDSEPHALDSAKRTVERIKKELEVLKDDNHTDTIDHHKSLQSQLREAEEVLKDLTMQQKSGLLNRTSVSDVDIGEVVSSLTGVPVSRLALSERERLLKMEAILGESVIGQKPAIEAIAKSIRRSRAGLNDPNRPTGSFFFLGPTGVGKTELAKALARFLFEDESAMVRLDMSEFQEKHTVSRLVGSPPGYTGSEDGGQLTEAVRMKPYSVVLFDEVEKGHPDIFNLLLQILDDGRLSDSKARLVDFKNTVVIMTSNVGSKFLLESSLANNGVITEEAGEFALAALREKFRPEFLGRIDEVIKFHGLTKENVGSIADLQLSKICKMIVAKKMRLEFSTEARDFLIEKGFNPAYGARPLRQCIQRYVQDELATLILEGRFDAGDTIVSVVDGDKLSFIKKV